MIAHDDDEFAPFSEAHQLFNDPFGVWPIIDKVAQENQGILWARVDRFYERSKRHGAAVDVADGEEATFSGFRVFVCAHRQQLPNMSFIQQTIGKEERLKHN
jgi:hypothetical protein